MLLHPYQRSIKVKGYRERVAGGKKRRKKKEEDGGRRSKRGRGRGS